MCVRDSHQPPSSKKNSGVPLRKMHTTPEPLLLFAQVLGKFQITPRSLVGPVEPPGAHQAMNIVAVEHLLQQPF